MTTPGRTSVAMAPTPVPVRTWCAGHRGAMACLHRCRRHLAIQAPQGVSWLAAVPVAVRALASIIEIE